jgi:hypothetical protein
MVDTRTRLIMDAVDNASGVIKKVGGEVGKAGKGFKDLANEIPGLNQAMSLLTNPVALAGAGIAAAGKFAADATRETLDYNRQIRDLAQNLNISTIETSRIIQTMDDFGVEQASVTSALEMALKNGFSPTVDTLARMADEYNNIADPTERAAKLTEVFGRNWTELVPALKQGGDAIRKGAAAQDAALLVTEEAAAATTEYDKALDELNDNFEALKRKVGNAVVPALTATVKWMNTGESAMAQLGDAYKKHMITMVQYSDIMNDLGHGLITEAQAIERLDKAVGDYETELRKTDRIEEIRADRYREAIIPATEDATKATEDATKAVEELARASKEDFEDSTKRANDFIAELEKIYDVNFSDVDLGLASMIESNINAMKLENAGGGAWDDAVRQVLHMKETGKISNQIAEDLLTTAAVGFEQAKVRAGLENVWEGASNLAATLKIPEWKAYEMITQPVIDQLEYINGLSAYVYVGVQGPGAGYVDSVAATANVTNSQGEVVAEVRAAGGPVSAGNPYWVGDGGEPELFVPSTNGTIVPAHNMAGSGGGTINIYFQGPVNSMAEAKEGANQGVLAALRAAGRA